MSDTSDVWRGALASVVLKTMEVMGTLHGYGLARRVEQTSGDILSINYGTYYRLTRAGWKRLEKESREWEQTTFIMARFLSPGEKLS